MAKTRRNASNQIAVVVPQKADVYLSCSWQKDKGRDVSWDLINRLDQRKVLCLGDVDVGGDQDPSRIKRIVHETSGFAVVLPFRSSTDWFTSEYIWQEVEIAAAQDIPMLILVDKQIQLTISKPVGDRTQIAIANQSELKPILVRNANLLGPLTFDANADSALKNYAAEFDRFVELTTNKSPSRPKPFAFLSTRLKSDFAHARHAVAAAVDESIGLKCLWADSPEYSAQIEGIHDRAKFLIKESQFVIVDLTFGPESPVYDSPSRAHEVGIAQAFDKEIFATAQKPRREPYFSASNLQLKFWQDEEDLRRQVKKWADATDRQKAFGRRVYNHELDEATLSKTKFSFDPTRRYIAPNAHPLSTFERTVVAIGFAMIALGISLLARDLLKFDDTFDFAAIVAAFFTLVFASDLSQMIRLHLGRWAPLRWIVPAFGIMLLMVWAALKFGGGT